MYEVIKNFVDLQTGHIYKVGDLFPKDGDKVSDSRIEKLASSSNRQGTPLIVKKGMATESLNTAITPAQSEKVEQENSSPVEKKSSGQSPKKNQNRKNNKRN